MIRQWHSIQQVWSKMAAYEDSLYKRYKRVGLFRPDVYYTHPIQIDDNAEVAVIPSMMYKPTLWGGYNDRMFYGKRMYAEIWATDRFNSVDAYLQWQQLNTDTKKKRGLHGEDFMRFLLATKWHVPLVIKDICFQRIRSSGQILSGDCAPMFINQNNGG